ncbi:male-specific lethal 3 homolog isoform X2 [Ornithodoros turicata]|uniref:male-specific lethal 3 homolog isoform X2 n=1 Tax=Ornithodoros turicata TaxID=34597 RepID=UPI003138A475
MTLLQQHGMVSTRGVKFKFSEGEKVLCYEPDSSKAKVLYDSKVLELVVDKDSRGRKVAEYLIHFSGWNSSWDRCVAEEFILPDNPENRKLQKRLAEEAAQKLLQAGKAKRRKVPAILKESINKKLNEKRQRQNEKKEKERAESTTTTEDSSSSESQQSSEDDNEAGEDGEGKDDDEQEEEEEEEEEESEEEEEVAAEGTFCLDVPQLLKEKLEDDCYYVTCKKKLLQLPCKPNVLDVLEAYVRHYATYLHLRVATSKPQDTKSSSNQLPIDIAHTRLDLCKEMVDGLRILFDHALPELLLYSSERKQYEIIVLSHKSKSHDTPAEKENKKEQAPAQQRDVGSHRSRSRLTSQNGSSGTDDSSPVRRGSRSPSERRALRSADKTVESAEENVTEKKPSATERKPSAVERKPSATSDMERKPPMKSTTERKLSMTSTTERKSSVTPAPERKQSATSAPERRTSSSTSASERKSSLASAPEQVPNAARHSSSEDGPANGAAGSLLDRRWRLLPAEEHEKAIASRAPSSVYGAVHLLRLFVKLPDLLSRMGMSEKKLEHLRAHLTRLLEHLAERHEELFSPSAYQSAHRVMAELES